MTQLDRIALGARAFCLAAAVGLSALTRDLVALQMALALTLVAFSAWWLCARRDLRHAWVAVVEGGFAGLLIGMAGGGRLELLPYVIAPPLVAGLARGVVPLAATVLVEALFLVPVTAGALTTDVLLARFTVVAPWLLTGLGAGLLGAWIQVIGLAPRPPAVVESYDAVRRLLTQLRTVARRLSSGLDPVGMAIQLQGLLTDRIGDSQSAVFVRTEGGALSPLVYRGDEAAETLSPDDPLVSACWTEMVPRHAPVAEPGPGRRHRIALPLRVGARMIGVVLADADTQPSYANLRGLMRTVDDLSLRLDAALAFDEVRGLATVEERDRLAREIHDGIAQELASLGYAVDDLIAGTVDPEQERRLRALRQEMTRVVSELRLSIFDLRSRATGATSLGTALSAYVHQVGAQSRMTVHLSLDEAPTRLRSEVETELLRIAQEAITNARKHAEAENLWVDCRVDPPYARLQVRDDGTGLKAAREDSYGVRIMHERAARIGARLDISGDPHHDGPGGTQVTITLGETDTDGDDDTDAQRGHRHGPAGR